MSECSIVRQEKPDYQCLRILVDGHHAYRRSFAKHKRESFVGLAAHGTGGAIVGGLLGRIHCDALILDVLWVAETAREAGLGRRLMQAVHQIARDEDVHVVYHELRVPEALPFFEKLGYRVAARLESDSLGSWIGTLRSIASITISCAARAKAMHRNRQSISSTTKAVTLLAGSPPNALALGCISSTCGSTTACAGTVWAAS